MLSSAWSRGTSWSPEPLVCLQWLCCTQHLWEGSSEFPWQMEGLWGYSGHVACCLPITHRFPPSFTWNEPTKIVPFWTSANYLMRLISQSWVVTLQYPCTYFAITPNLTDCFGNEEIVTRISSNTNASDLRNCLNLVLWSPSMPEFVQMQQVLELAI